MPQNGNDYLILHCVPNQIPDGWHDLQISHWHPFKDDYGDKVAFYMLVLDAGSPCPLLQWIGPLTATPRNKTGRLLKALGTTLTHGQTTDPDQLTGLKISGLIQELPEPEGRVKVILDFKPFKEN